jgi:SAM-dependent methyltransferase
VISEGLCKICSGELEPTYNPKNSLISLVVVLCKFCGFVQTTKSEAKSVAAREQGSDISSLSCDADYSPIRVGKQQMTNHDLTLIASKIESFANLTCLDMSSARGHFALWAAEATGQPVVCLEPDSYMSESYRTDKRLKVFQSDYRDLFNLHQFDFIYSCHTLEHFSDPIRYLRFVHDHLNESGSFYLNVPNLEGVRDSINLDDFFYDRHRVYFDVETLFALLVNTGFDVTAEWHNSACLRFLVRKTIEPAIKVSVSRFAENKSILLRYMSGLTQNRNRLPEIVSSIVSTLKPDTTLVVVGCGRMLDALIKYGEFPINRADYLIDNYLGLATEHLYGRRLYRFDNFFPSENNLHFLIVARTSNSELEGEITRRFPYSTVTFVSEFF